MGHVVLLGDSIFDNGAYINGQPDVVRQLQSQLPADWAATLLAQDGAITSYVLNQLHRLPAGATHLVVSAGGNDALEHLGILEERVRSSAETLEHLTKIAQDFESDYQETIDAVRRPGLPVVLCTIYYPRFTDARVQRLAVTALSVFNDAILRTAFRAGVPVVDLRLVCDSADDYANAIEPSVQGGKKIAATIAHVVQNHDFGAGRSAVFIAP